MCHARPDHPSTDINDHLTLLKSDDAGQRLVELLGTEFELPHLSALVDLLVNA